MSGKPVKGHCLRNMPYMASYYQHEKKECRLEKAEHVTLKDWISQDKKNKKKCRCLQGYFWWLLLNLQYSRTQCTQMRFTMTRTSVIELWWSRWPWLLSASKWKACCLCLNWSVRFEDPLQVWYCQWSAVHCVPLRMARSGAIALWCQTVMSRVQGNTINTMARISLLFGISRIGYLARHYLEEK